MALLEKAAGQGHAYAMLKLGYIHDARKEHARAAEWYTAGAAAGLPEAMFNIALCLDKGQGVAAPDYPAVGPSGHFPPHHPTHFEPAFHESNGIL